ncbi:dTMP kinase [Sediminicurvatus halobius]|uniref:Thymidylate kinase n=1 Tax=Sediminicurvatus halobius TaxID=2182432 RepID=A0A2U2N2N8_9GAMM|nr:dTMP kinase [Spiribacter halobius]PWG63244.1 dTMP kinase [Spiribacter halobius]UEX76684.1 dTMP kinase [Spiribacter halobius]
MSRGRFITVEGLEGAGKTTALAGIRAWIEARGAPVRQTREPGGTPLGEAIRELLLGHRQEGMSARAETLLVFAARAEHLEQVIRPALAAGEWVLCDRFTDATYAYQGGGRGLGSEAVRVLEDWTQGTLRPHLTLFLDVPVATGRARAAGRSEPDRFEIEREAFFERARAAYLERCTAEPARMRRIDASAEPEVVQRHIEAVLSEVFGNDG